MMEQHQVRHQRFGTLHVGTGGGWVAAVDQDVVPRFGADVVREHSQVLAVAGGFLHIRRTGR